MKLQFKTFLSKNSFQKGRKTEDTQFGIEGYKSRRRPSQL